jgi:hypothetical protein
MQGLHVISAMLKTGADKIHNDLGNGNCIMADFARNLYAVSDAPEYFNPLTVFWALWIFWEQARIFASGNPRYAAFARADKSFLLSL